jgi:hypothetical protein
VSEIDTDDLIPQLLWQAAGMGIVAMAYLATGAYGLLVVIGDLLGWAWDNVLRWPGMTPSSGRERLQSDVLALTVQATAVAAVGVVLASWWRRRLALAVFGGGVGVALVVGLSAWALVSPDEPERPAWEAIRAAVWN